MTEGAGTGARDVSYSVQVTRHPRFQATAVALAVRTAEQAGCAPARARELGQAVDRVIGWMIDRPGRATSGAAAEAPGTITIDFRGHPGRLEVDLSCSDESAEGLRTIVDTAGGLGAIGSLVDSAEMTVAHGRPCCRLRCQGVAP